MCLYRFRSQSCPHCRRTFTVASLTPIYLECPDSSANPSTSAAAVNPSFTLPAHQQNRQVEETIESLLAEIDSLSWKQDEYGNHLADFDSHSETVAVLRSKVDDQDETLKVLLAQLDEQNVVIQDLKRQLLLADVSAHTTTTDITSLNSEVDVLKDKLVQATEELNKCMDEKRQLQWQLTKKETETTKLNADKDSLTASIVNINHNYASLMAQLTAKTGKCEEKLLIDLEMGEKNAGDPVILCPTVVSQNDEHSQVEMIATESVKEECGEQSCTTS